jgi:cytidylate kinase
VTRSVIAVSRALGANGEEIAGAVARQLGYRYVDNEIIDKAAKAVGVTPAEVSQAEHTDSLLSRLVTALGTTIGMDQMAVPPDYAYMNTYSQDYQKLIERVIRQTAEEGNVVLVAHGASIPLAGMDGLLRVFITGSPEVRAGRIASTSGVDAGKAADEIEESDKQRAQFLRRFYKVSREQPTHYDLVINTDVLSADEAAALVISAAKN